MNDSVARMYIQFLSERLGVNDLEKEEKDFLKMFFNSREDSPGKRIYSESWYRYKRFYPRFMIRRSVLKFLDTSFAKIDEMPELFSRKEIKEILADRIMFEALKSYCTYEKKISMYY